MKSQEQQSMRASQSFIQKVMGFKLGDSLAHKKMEGEIALKFTVIAYERIFQRFFLLQRREFNENQWERYLMSFTFAVFSH